MTPRRGQRSTHTSQPSSQGQLGPTLARAAAALLSLLLGAALTASLAHGQDASHRPQHDAGATQALTN